MQMQAKEYQDFWEEGREVFTQGPSERACCSHTFISGSVFQNPAIINDRWFQPPACGKKLLAKVHYLKAEIPPQNKALALMQSIS